MIVDAINNGIVIDHICAGRGMELYRILELDKLECPVALIKNVVSSKMGKKDIIKIDTEIDIDFAVLGYIDPNITVNVIRNGELQEKKHPELPDMIYNVVKCKNPRCITTTEQELPHVFKLADRENHVYRCIYCETKANSKK